MKFAWTITLLLMAGSASAASSLSFDGELAATYDGNPGNMHAGGDVRPTQRVAAGGSATWLMRFGEYTALQLRGALDGDADLRLEDLSFGRLGARVRYLAKPGEGFYVPVLALSVSANYKASGSRLRTGEEWRAGLFVREPVTTQIAVRGGFGWTRSSTRGRVFDGQTRAYEFGLDWALMPGLSLYGEARFADGPIVVSAETPGAMPKAHLYLQEASNRVEADPAFGDQWWAYRLDARTRIFTLGANVPLDADLSLDAQLLRAHSVSDAYNGASFNYERWIGSVSLLKRF